VAQPAAVAGLLHHRGWVAGGGDAVCGWGGLGGLGLAAAAAAGRHVPPAARGRRLAPNSALPCPPSSRPPPQSSASLCACS
jgi:hypothetical protein